MSREEARKFCTDISYRNTRRLNSTGACTCTPPIASIASIASIAIPIASIAIPTASIAIAIASIAFATDSRSLLGLLVLGLHLQFGNSDFLSLDREATL